MQERATFAPGARILVREEEWLVKTTLPTNAGGLAVRAVGLSELVRNHERIFLSELDTIQELRPEATKLVIDDSPQYRRTRLYLESLLRRTPPTDARVYLGDKGAANQADYQLQPTHLALQSLRPRILIADGVGLGKTIEVGILLSELIKRGRGERILVIAIRSMLAQFQQELWARFAIPLVRLDSVGLQRVRSKIPTSKNPFYYYNRAIISIDTLKNDAQYRHYLEQCHWDVIVIDECHNVANSGSQRNRLAGLLARTCDSLLLTSATPHNGTPESFANLMNMLEPTAIADTSHYAADEIAGLFVRRFKKDIEDQVGDQFSERQVELLKLAASPAEERFFDQLATLHFRTLQGSGHDALFRVGLLKGFLSSPAAAVESIDARCREVGRRLARLQDTPTQRTGGNSPALESGGLAEGTNETEDASDEELQPALFADLSRKAQAIQGLSSDLAALQDLRKVAIAVTDAEFSKYQHLLKLLGDLGVNAKPTSPRLIIFSERLSTLHFLRERLRTHFAVGADAIVEFHAGLPDTEQQQIVEDFGKEDSPVRILLASDVASEGVNLHYYCHLLVHFDIPWSLITLEQRNGRIDRYGQHTPPLIHYLLTLSQNATLTGDLRILERLIEKEQEAHRNIGDAATLLGLHDAHKEEDTIAQAMAAGLPAEEVLPDTIQEPEWWQNLMNEVEQKSPKDELCGKRLSLYDHDLAFARTAFDELLAAEQIQNLPDYHPSRPEFTLLAPDDLRKRCAFLPQEAVPSDWSFRLSTDRQRVMESIASARKRQGEWPQLQLFWDLHPVMEWLLDNLLIRFGRHEAPVIITRELAANEAIFFFQGILSNQRSQPVIAKWFGLLHDGQYDWTLLDLETVLAHTGLTRNPSNRGELSIQKEKLEALLPAAVTAARKEMAALRMERATALGERLRKDERKVRGWYDATQQRLQAQLVNASPARRPRLQFELDEASKLREQRSHWLKETLSTDPTPFVRLAAVFTGS